MSREAELRGFSLSLYSRLVEAGVPYRFLDTQYRAHPMLMEFSASCIYQGKLRTGIDASQRPLPGGIPWPSPKCPAAFFECGAEEHLEGESKANQAEAKIVRKLVQLVLDHGELGLADIGVVTPYKGQVRVLRSTIYKGGIKVPDGMEESALEIHSVDNFQGREKEIIIFSAVRCNDLGSVGFLADWRRLNVMITRAKRGLVVVGSAKTLCKDKHWKEWLQFTEKQGGAPKGTVAQAEKGVALEGSLPLSLQFDLDLDCAEHLIEEPPTKKVKTTAQPTEQKDTSPEGWSVDDWSEIATWTETPQKSSKKPKLEVEHNSDQWWQNEEWNDTSWTAKPSSKPTNSKIKIKDDWSW